MKTSIATLFIFFSSICAASGGIDSGCQKRFIYTDGVHVINTDTLEVEATIDTGDGPDPMSMWYPPGKK